MNASLAAAFREHLETLNARLGRALEQAGLDCLVIHAGTPPIPYWDDQPYPFRPEPLFVQWCPLTDAAGSALVLAPDEAPRLLRLSPESFWHAGRSEPDPSWAAWFRIDTVGSEAERDALLDRLTGHIGHIGRGGRDEAGTSQATPARIARRWLDYERAYKTAYEIARMATANRIAAVGHAAVEAAFAGRVSELDLDFVYMQASRQRADDLPYPNIVAIDGHAAVLHYQHPESRATNSAATLLIDAGARDGGYAADITRTHLSDSSPLREIHRSMEALQQSLCADAVAGMEFTTLNERAHQLLADLLSTHGIVTCDGAMAYESGITRAFLPHGLGHLLGLQVHDAAGRQREPLAPPTPPPDGHPHLRLTRRLEPGFVVTIEPGLYFIDSVFAALPASRRRLVDRARFEALKPHGGVRIEDDVVIEAGDNTNLSRAAFAALEEGPTAPAPS